MKIAQLTRSQSHRSVTSRWQATTDYRAICAVGQHHELISQ